jgi:DNA-binding transcriptional LysR family regulator
VQLTPKQLKILVTVARTLSFSRTAEIFHVTQPTLTKIVQEIEEVVGAQLFDRTTRSVRLTKVGADILPVAMRVAQDYDIGIGEMEGLARRRNKRLAIAALPTLAAMLLPQPISALRREHPDMHVRVHDVLNDDALALLRSHEVDLAITAADAVRSDLSYDEIAKEPFVALVASGSQWRLPSVWSENELEGLPLITMPREASTRSLVEARFMQCGIPFRPFLEVRNLLTIARFVKEGCGVALLPLLGALLLRDSQLEIVRLAGAPERVIASVVRRDYEPGPLVQRVAASIREHARELQARLQ